MNFPRCPDCSCEHVERCVQYADLEEAVRELKEGHILMVWDEDKAGQCERACNDCAGLFKVVFIDVESERERCYDCLIIKVFGEVDL